jgi:hypothetical protein
MLTVALLIVLNILVLELRLRGGIRGLIGQRT